MGRKYFIALHNVSLAVRKGECVGLLGPNGAGKTTLLKLIGGLLYPSTGEISICGYDTKTHNHKVRHKVGYVLNEERSFYWRLTGRQNLEFFGILENLTGKRLRNRIAEVIDCVWLKDVQNVRVGSFSCGMRQRLAIARGLLSDPEVLVFDEPTKALDPSGTEDVRRLITELKERNKTIVLATHQIAEAEALCSRVCIVINGMISACEEASTIRHRDGLEAFYMKWVAQAGKDIC